MKERARNVRGAFECKTDLSARRILLIDDVMTTGATLREAARVVKLHGAAQIDVAVVARALKH
jgi:predicted amidophosphoribosyltransferase